MLFTLFAAGGIVGGVTAFPLIALVSRDEKVRTRRARAMVQRSFAAFLRLMKVARVARFAIEPEAARQLSEEHGTIIVANHPTLLDVVMLLAHTEQANCVVKAQLWRNPFLKWGVRAANYIPNDDLDTLMSLCERALREGEVLVVFPEATRTMPDQPIVLQRGAAQIALRAEASLRIVHIKCDPATLSKGEPWYRIPEAQPCFSLKVNGRLAARDYLQRGSNLAVAARRLTQDLQEQLSEDPFVDEGLGNRA